MFKKILYFIAISFHFINQSKETTMNNHEPIHVFAALKFPLDAVKDNFTLNIFKSIDATFGTKGIGLDSYQIEHIKKTYLYLIFLTKLEKIKYKLPSFKDNQNNIKQIQKDFALFLTDNGEQSPHMITSTLLQSEGWQLVTIDYSDIQNSTMWQYFCKSMITDIYAYLKLGLNMIHNTEKQEFNYIPHFETSYYDQDFEQLRNINAIVRIKIELEQQIQSHYLAMCKDWKNLPITETSSTSKKIKTNTTVYKATQLFSLTEFYKKTHDPHTLMGTRQKVTSGQSLNHQDFMSAPQMISPLKDYVFCYFLLYELYGQLTSFMTIQNLDQIISICSSSNVQPNIFPYTDNDYVFISELLATKSAAQKNHTNSINPPIKTYKKEDLRKHIDMLNPTRKPTEQYIQQKLSEYQTPKASVQGQSFFSFFAHLGSDIVHAATSAWSDIKSGAEDAWNAVKHAGESVGYGIAGLSLEVIGKGQEGNKLFKESQEDMKKSVNELTDSMTDFANSLKDGVVAPISEISGDLVGFVLDDQKIGQDLDQIIDNAASVIIDFTADQYKTILTGLVYLYTLPNYMILDVIQLTMAAVYATVGAITGNSQDMQNSLDICHCILRSLVTVYTMTAKVTKQDFATIMQSMSIAMNAVSTLFNDLIIEVCAIALTGGTSLIFDIVMSSTGNDKYNVLTKATNIVRNTLNAHREVENQVLGVAICIAVDVATEGAGTEADAAILDAASEDAFNDSISQAEDSIQSTEEELTQAQEKAEAAEKEAQQNPDDQEAQDKANEAKKEVQEKEEALNQKKDLLKKANDTKTNAIKEAKDLKYGKNFKEKLIKKAQNFFSKCKNAISKSANKTQSLFRSLTTAIKSLTSASPAAVSEIADTTSTVLESVSQEATATVQEVEPLAQDAKEVLPPEASQKITNNINNLSSKMSNLSKARADFQSANAELKAAQSDSQEFATAQKKLLNASKAVQKASLEVQSAQEVVQSSFNDALQYEKDFSKNPVQYFAKKADDSFAQADDQLKQIQQAEKDLKAAQSNLESEQALGNQEDIEAAQKGLDNAQENLTQLKEKYPNAEQDFNTAKNLRESLQATSQNTAKIAEEQEVTVSEKFSNKFKDLKEYLKSKGRSFRNLFKNNDVLVKEAENKLTTQQSDLTELNEQLTKDQENLEEATTKAKENPNDSDAQADKQRAEDQVKKTKQNIREKQREVDRAQDYAKEREQAAKESKWQKVKRAGGDILGSAGTFMNIIFNFTPIISSYNQDQKNLLQQKQQAQQMQDLWKANTETKISTIYNNLGYLEEFYEKEKTSIGNQILGLSLFQNYNYSSISQLEQSILQSLAMIFTLQLYPQPTSNLVAGNTGTLWNLACPYLDLYPSQGFYTTTIGRTDFPFAQEIAQAPELLSATSKTKIKEWFNQRCTAIDQKDEKNVLKKPTDPLTVSINFKFLYTLDSEFYVGIYMGKNFYDYFNTSYIAGLLGTTAAKLTAAYKTFENKLEAYPFNFNFINLNETYMAKMIVLYRKSNTEKISIGVYEHNMTAQEWLFTQELPASMQLHHNHEYNLTATLNGDKLLFSLITDNQVQTKITETVSVTPLDNQRQYGIVTSSAAIEWNQITPKVSIATTALRKPITTLISEKQRNKQNKLLIEDAINQNFGGQQLTIVNKQNALIFSQYVYASTNTDLTKTIPKSPADFLVFATNTNGVIGDLGKIPNSFTDNTTNVLVSLITGHVFDDKWNCVAIIKQPWKNYSSSEYAPFLPGINTFITQQQTAITKKLSAITFGHFILDIADPTLLANGTYLYTSMQTRVDASGKPTIDYLVFTPTIPVDPSAMFIGLPPTAKNTACLVSLITGNVYTKETIIPQKGVPTSSQPMIQIMTMLNFINYVQQLGTQLSTTIRTLQQNPNPTSVPQPTPASTIAKKQSLTKEAPTVGFKFHFAPRNFANRQKQAAGGFKFHFPVRPKK